MRVTVAICTYNRAALLDRTLDAFEHLRIPSDVEWEILVVNNNSSDRTDDVVASHAARVPVRRLFERQPGKSNAANRAVREARGELLLWTDDDVIVDREWLAEYVSAARQWPHAAYFGGTVDPWFETDPPEWIANNVQLLGEPYALAQHGERIFALNDQAVVGANMATRTAVQREFPFNPTLGPTGGRAMRGEDTELVARFRAAGLPGVWVGSAKVRHWISNERLSVKYLWHWYSGLGNYVAHKATPSNVPRLFGAPRWALKKYAALLVQYCFAAPRKNERWLRLLRETALMNGYIQHTRRQLQ
jgi:glycosyltransferase involved in cell wall biosynthesis